MKQYSSPSPVNQEMKNNNKAEDSMRESSSQLFRSSFDFFFFFFHAVAQGTGDESDDHPRQKLITQNEYRSLSFALGQSVYARDVLVYVTIYI